MTDDRPIAMDDSVERERGDDITVLRDGVNDAGDDSAVEPRILKQRFVLERKLGAGGMGTVYQARDLRRVEARDRYPYLAVKVLNNDFRKHPDAFIALQREASKSQALAHPSIVAIYDFDKDGDVPFMTMELLEGQELAELLRDYPNGLPDAMAWPILEDVCAGLKRAHDAGITHADFKPGNVFVLRTGRAKILDFGIARAARINAGTSDETVFDPARFAALTPAFASAEMLRGEEPEPLDDIYSLGVVAYLLFTGQHPYLRVRADEASAQGVRPKRIRRLGRRRCSTPERMLALERAGRPRGMDEVIAGLLPASPLKYWAGAAAAVLLVAAGIGVWSGFSSNANRDLVARDVLIDAQVRRIDELLAEAAFTGAWEQRLGEETERLAHIAGADVEVDAVRARILDRFYVEMRESDELDATVAVLRSAERFAPGQRFDAGQALLGERLQAELEALLTNREPDRDWMAAVAGALERVRTHVDDRRLVAELEHAIGEAYVAAIAQRIEAGDAALAADLLDAAMPLVFDIDLLDGVAQRLVELERTLQRREALAARRAEQSEVDAALTALGATSCQRIDASVVKRRHDELTARYPWARTIVLTGTTRVLADCIAELAEMDHDRALALQQAALREFGAVPALQAFRHDPCAMRYLVGRGHQPGRSGFCADVLTSGGTGPRLVVVPGSTGRFAIARFETSWRDVAPYCEATGRCAVPVDPGQPVTGFTLADAEAYASWLSEETNFRYRLPTLAEWRQSASEPPVDPNRNCQVQITGVSRGTAPVPATAGELNGFGLVNALGNVQEWAWDGDRLRAVGGAYTDPISRCEPGFARDHAGTADAITGFRLVREIP
jgi:serine/threonine protein kinase